MSNNYVGYTHQECVEAITLLMLSKNAAPIVFKHGDNTTRYILNSFIRVETKEESLFTRLDVLQECLSSDRIEFYKRKVKHSLVTIFVTKDAAVDAVVKEYGASRTSELIIVAKSDVERFIKTQRKKGEDILIDAKWVSGKCTDSEGRILFPPIPRKSTANTSMRKIAFQQNANRKYGNKKTKVQRWRKNIRKFSNIIPLK